MNLSKKSIFAIRIKVLLVCAVAGLSLATGCLAAPKQTTQTASIKDSRTQQVLGNQFRCGFYYYKTRVNDVPLQEIENDINRMADLGFNYVHANVAVLGSNAQYPQLDRLLQVCAARNMTVLVQCTGTAYLSNALAGRHTDQWKPGWNMQRLVDAVTPFILEYQQSPNVIGFSVQEEPDVEVLPLLREYYQAILSEIPNAPLSLLYNQLNVAVEDTQNIYPQNSSHDDYPFKRGTVNGVYNLRTPGFALQFYTSQMDAFQQLAQNKRQSFEAAFSGFAEQGVLTGASQHDRNLAEINNQGFSLDETGQVLRWNRYRPPLHYVSAMCWTALCKGADSLADYAWMEASTNETRKTRTALVLGWDNQGSLVLDEFAAFANMIRPFGKLMRSISRDITSFTLPANAGDVVPIAPAQNPLLQITGQDPSDIVWDSFNVPGYQGKLAIVVNTKIGSWSDGESPLVLNNNDPFHIDNEGNLIDFVPFTGMRAVHGKVLLPNVEATDLMTGTAIPVDANGNLELDIAPGAGRIVFFAPAGSGEAQALMGEYQLPINTASS